MSHNIVTTHSPTTTTTTTTTTGASATQGAALLQVVAAVFLCLLAGLGAVGNSLVLATITRIPQMRRLTYFLVGNLSAVGLLNCLMTIPLHVVHNHARGDGPGQSWEGGGEAGCKVQAHINFTLILCTLVNSTAIALSRYRAVTSPHGASGGGGGGVVRGGGQYRAGVVKLLFFCWVLPALVALSASPFLGYNGLMSDCFFLVTDQSLWYTTVALALPALASTACMLASYALIIKKVRDSHLKVANLCRVPRSVTDNAPQVSREDRTVSDSEAPVSASPSVSAPAAAPPPGPTHDSVDTDMQDDSQSQSQVTSPSASVGGIKIYTTMVPDDSIQVTPSYFQVEEEEMVTSFPGVSSRDAVTPSPAQRGPSLGVHPTSGGAPVLQTPAHPIDTLAASPVRPRPMDTLSVPARTASSVSSRTDEAPPSPTSSIFTITSSSGLSLVPQTSSSSSSSSKKKLKEHGQGRRRLKKEVRLTVHLFLAFILFCLLYLPLCFSHALHALYVLGQEAWVVFYTLALSFSSNAWLVYALLNRDFRRAFLALLRGRRAF